jgi:hypothetical protein
MAQHLDLPIAERNRLLLAGGLSFSRFESRSSGCSRTAQRRSSW